MRPPSGGPRESTLECYTLYLDMYAQSLHPSSEFKVTLRFLRMYPQNPAPQGAVKDGAAKSGVGKVSVEHAKHHLLP